MKTGNSFTIIINKVVVFWLTVTFHESNSNEFSKPRQACYFGKFDQRKVTLACQMATLDCRILSSKALLFFARHGGETLGTFLNVFIALSFIEKIRFSSTTSDI
jgi:hypothetical protein